PRAANPRTRAPAAPPRPAPTPRAPLAWPHPRAARRARDGHRPATTCPAAPAPPSRGAAAAPGRRGRRGGPPPPARRCRLGLPPLGCYEPLREPRGRRNLPLVTAPPDRARVRL